MVVDLIRYDLLVQDALRGVVRQVLSGAARDGLPGDHHFYISFHTHAQGVRLSSRMRELYPDEMTIILQHQFWDLSVTEDAFEVGLSFRNVPEMLLIPFDAVTRFFDPSVGFELKFVVEDEATEALSATTEIAAAANGAEERFGNRAATFFAGSWNAEAARGPKRCGGGRACGGAGRAPKRDQSRLDRRLSQEELTLFARKARA